jgi:hypothetical protein
VRWHGHGRQSHCWRSLQLSRCYFGATNQTIWPNHVVALAGSEGPHRRRRVCWPPGSW